MKERILQFADCVRADKSLGVSTSQANLAESIHPTLAVHSKTEPEKISALLGQEPDDVIEKGDSHEAGRFRIEYAATAWYLSTEGKVRENWPEAHITWLLDQTFAEWIEKVEAALWNNLVDLECTFSSADYVNGLVVFNIGGNNFRLLAEIVFQGKIVRIAKVGIHAEYDGWKL